MRILVTGANGFTGIHLASVAQAAGHEAIAVQADLLDAPALAAEVWAANADAAVHLAAISTVTHADNREFYDVNLFGTLNLLDALSQALKRPQCVLLASSANVYGNCDASPITEAQPPAPVNHYAVSKLAMEHMARTYAEQLPIVIARPFNYTGPGQATSFLVPKLVAHFARCDAGIELGNLDVEREFNDVRMVCNAYLQLLQHGEPGEIYNVCTGRPVALQEMLNTLTALAGHSMAVVVNPAFVRANEIRRLCGSPAKLTTTIGPLKEFALTDTLQWMLQAAQGKVQPG